MRNDKKTLSNRERWKIADDRTIEEFMSYLLTHPEDNTLNDLSTRKRNKPTYDSPSDNRNVPTQKVQWPVGCVIAGLVVIIAFSIWLGTINAFW